MVATGRGHVSSMSIKSTDGWEYVPFTAVNNVCFTNAITVTKVFPSPKLLRIGSRSHFSAEFTISDDVAAYSPRYILYVYTSGFKMHSHIISALWFDW